jgi:hypothetical protein
MLQRFFAPIRAAEHPVAAENLPPSRAHSRLDFADSGGIVLEAG